ncbi:MFS transporter [Streptomyces sp. JJ38]|uniref:MFS transporter n=1 Tax=Streptomyces sp. JJ38 TaxID=2738128 RepID=UPI001C58443A|nr:MFS transporter [Streptomyces sp. JJ38]MBW1595598.1 MFS transporter [Streptomyces sp. JJ38]
MPTPRVTHGWTPAAAAVSTAAWGANQFTPLTSVYRMSAHWHSVSLTAMFSTYLLGLAPGLLLGGPAADRHGRRRVVRCALVLCAAASVTLALAAVSEVAVYVSRLATGVAAGCVFAAGTAWLRELSTASGRPDAGARRAVYATGSGFVAGALAAGALAEWAPFPTAVPCLVHALVCLLVLGATGGVPETAPRRAVTRRRPHPARLLRAAVGHPRFRWVVLPATPAVFGAATVAYVVLPPLVAGHVPGHAPLFSGLVAALTLAVGAVVQPWAARLDHACGGRATLVAMATVIAGLLVGALAVRRGSAGLVVTAAIVLGAGYGLALASGLREMERLAPESFRPSAATLYQITASGGFLTPLLLAVTADAVSYPAQLESMATIGVLCLVVAATYSRRHPPRPGTPPAGYFRAPAAGARPAGGTDGRSAAGDRTAQPRGSAPNDRTRSR